MDLLKYLRQPKTFWILVGSTLFYFLATNVFQSRLTFHNFDMIDAYPGYPILPEPYEIPLYLLGYIAIPLMVLAISFLWRFRVFRYVFLFLIAASVLVIGSKSSGIIPHFHIFSLSEISNYFRTRGVLHFFWLIFTKRIYVVRLSFLMAGLAFLLFLFKRTRVGWIQKIDESGKLQKFVPYFFVFLAVLLFHPNFPSQEGFTNFVVSPASEIIHGKRLLYETSSIYGVLNVYFVALLMKFVLPLSYKGFALFLMVYYFLFYAALYKMLKLWMGSTLFALVGTWLGLVAGFFLLTDPYVTAYTFPGQSAYRQGVFVFLGLLVALFARRQTRVYRELLLFSSAIAFFWNIDTGVYINIAVFATLAYFEFNSQSKPLTNLKKIFLLGLRHLVYIVGIFGIITLTNYFVYGSWPNWFLELADISTFNTGYGKYPMPKFGLFEGYVVVYLVILLWVLGELIHKKKVDLPIVYLAIYGIFSLIYYVGNSVWSYLNMVALPMLLLVWFAFYRYFQKQHEFFSPRLIAAGFYGFLAFVAALSLIKLPVVFAYRDYSDISLSSIDKKDMLLYQDAQYIKARFKEVGIPLFHDDDGKLLLMAGKINSLYLQEDDKRLYSLYDNYLVIYRRHVRGLIRQIQTSWPQYVFITNNPDERARDLENFVKEYYHLDKSLNTLNIYELNEIKP